jgi:hypothetical protein
VGTIYYQRNSRDVTNDPSRFDQVWMNDGSGVFTPGPSVGAANDTSAVTLIDLDNDGDLDALLSARNQALILWNDGRGGFTSAGEPFTPGRDYAYQAADVDGDGLADIFAMHLRRGYVIWRNLGGGQFERQR